MEMAKVTSKGQITIPITIRRRLSINEGDKILFIDKPEGVMMVNPDLVGSEHLDAVVEATEVEKATPKPKAPPATVEDSGSSERIPRQVRNDDDGESTPHSTLHTPHSDTPYSTLHTPHSEPPRRYIPPVEEEYEEPIPKQAGGVDLSTLLDDFRSIGSLN